MSTVYVIRDWDTHFENAKSRKVKDARWVAVPNRHDGRGYRRMMQEPDGPSLLGAWLAIIQVASQMPLRGHLRDERGPVGPQDIHDKTFFPVELISRALEFFSSDRIGWIYKIEDEIQGPEGPQPATTGTQKAPIWKGMEGNGREGNGSATPRVPAAAPTHAPAPLSAEEFAAPDPQQIAYKLAHNIFPSWPKASSLPLLRAALCKLLGNAIEPEALAGAIERSASAWREYYERNPKECRSIQYWIEDGTYLQSPPRANNQSAAEGEIQRQW